VVRCCSWLAYALTCLVAWSLRYSLAHVSM
jgi:hypothetical protein